jgi:UDP-glucose 4-epimerase
MPIPPDSTSESTGFWSGRKVLVTGGMGFIGSTLAHRLVGLGARVGVLDALIPDHGGNPANLGGIHHRLRLDIADLRDRDRLRAILPGHEVIFNLAGQVSHLDSMRDPVTDLNVNVLAQVILLEACREIVPEATILYASTRQIYGRPDYLPVDEGHPIRPVDVNGINKLAGEAYHTLYHQVYGLRTVSLRLTNTYGPRMRIKDARQTFLGIWLRRAIENAAIEVWGGEQQRDLVFVEDVAEAFLLAAVTPALIGRAVNLGGEPPVTLDRLADTLVALAGSGRIEHHVFPAERKRIDIGDYYADDRVFRAATGWAPKVPLREGLRRALDYYRADPAPYL